MPTFLGVGARIRERLIDIGYTKPDGTLRVQDFALEHRFPATFLWDWLSDRRTPIKDLHRLAEALQANPGWLLLGESEVVAPAARAKNGTAASARRPAQPLAARRGNGRRRQRPFPAPLPGVEQRPRRRIMSGSRSTGRVREAA